MTYGESEGRGENERAARVRVRRRVNQSGNVTGVTALRVEYNAQTTLRRPRRIPGTGCRPVAAEA